MTNSPRRRRSRGLFRFLTQRSPAASRRRPLARPAQLSLEPLGLRQMLSVTPSITSMSLTQGPVTGGTTLQITGSNLVNAAGKSLVDKVRFYDSTANVVTFLTEVSSAQVTLLSGGKAAAATIKLTVPDFSAVTSWSLGPNTWIGSELFEWNLRAAVRLKDGTESAQSPYVVFKEPNGDGTYISAGVDTTASITVGETKSSQRQDAPSDRDWWKVSLKKDTEYVFKVKPSNALFQGNWKYSADLVIRDSKGKAIASENRVQPGNGRLLAGVAWNKTYEMYFDPPADGNYFLDVGGSGVDWTSYELSAAKASYVSDWTLGSTPVTDDFSSNPSTKGTVAVGGAVKTAKVDVSGDRDWFKVTLNKGEKYQFSAKPSGQTDIYGNLISWFGSSYYQVTIKLRDSSGREVFTNASVGDSYSETWPDGKPIYSANKADLILTAPATGTYYVDVGAGDWSFRGFYGEGLGVGPYDLSVRALPTYAARMKPPASRTAQNTVYEGDVLTATVSTTNVPADTTLYWALSGTGITAGDFSTGGLTGSGKVSKTGGFSFSQTIAKDQATEGSETVELRLYSDADRTLQVGQTASIRIVDSSRTPSYRTEFGIVSGVTFTPVETIQEGASLTARLSVTNTPIDMVYYTLSGTGVAAGDFSKGSLVGSGRLVNGGDSFTSLSVPLTLSRDKATEGDEVLRVAFYSDAARTTQLGTATVIVVDTSTAAPPTYQVTASDAVIDEGGSVTSTVKTTNVDPGATLYWSLSGTGITAADFSTGPLTGSGKTSSDGTFSFAHAVASDKATEMDEALQIKLFSDAARTKQVGTTATVTVRDTSLFGTAFDGAQLPIGLRLDVPSAAHASISLDTTNKELDFGASQNTDMWDTRNNVPIAWVASPVVPVGASWSVETHVRLAKKDEGGQVAGLVFYGADGGRPAFTFGIDNWAWWNTGVHLQGMGTNDPSVWNDLRTAEDLPADNVFLRVVVTENGASDRYDFFYKLSAGDSWTLLTGSFESSATNSRVGLFYKTDGAKSGASFKALNLARVS